MNKINRTISASICLMLIFLSFETGMGGQRDIRGPAGSQSFGEFVKVLPNGNLVVVDQYFTVAGGPDQIGAAYLYSSSGAMISKLTGSKAGDRVGSGGITVLANGNFVIVSYRWDNTTVPNAGVGTAGVDAGAVTWGNMETGVSGAVSEANSLVGTSYNDQVGDAVTRGQGGVTALSNGNYVVASPSWSRPSLSAIGAVTFCNGTTGKTGVVSTANSLVGSSLNDSRVLFLSAN